MTGHALVGGPGSPRAGTYPCWCWRQMQCAVSAFAEAAHNREYERSEEEIQKARKSKQSAAAESSEKRYLQALAERYIPERVALLKAMARAPSVLVPGGSYCRIIEPQVSGKALYVLSQPPWIQRVVAT